MKAYYSVLETINRIMAWKGYKPELTPHIEELKRISEKAGRRERVTDKEITFLNELETIIREPSAPKGGKGK